MFQLFYLFIKVRAGSFEISQGKELARDVALWVLVADQQFSRVLLKFHRSRRDGISARE